MKTVVAVESFDGFCERSLERARRVDKREHIPTERRITFEHPADMAAFLSLRLQNLLRAAIQQPRSVNDLATALKRRKPAVAKDVRTLQQAGLLTLSKRVSASQTQEEFVHAAAKEFEFRYRLSA